MQIFLAPNFSRPYLHASAPAIRVKVRVRVRVRARVRVRVRVCTLWHLRQPVYRVECKGMPDTRTPPTHIISGKGPEGAQGSGEQCVWVKRVLPGGNNVAPN